MTYTASTRTISGLTAGQITSNYLGMAIVFTIGTATYFGTIESVASTSIVLTAAANLPDSNGPVASITSELLNVLVPTSNSRITQLKQTIKAEAASMVQPDYNWNTAQTLTVIRLPDVIDTFPEQGVALGTRIWTPINAIRTLFNVDIHTWVQGVIGCDTSTDDGLQNLDDGIELYMQDLATFWASLTRKYVEDPTNPWNINFDKGGPQFYPMIEVGKNKNKATVIMEFHILMRKVQGTAW